MGFVKLYGMQRSNNINWSTCKLSLPYKECFSRRQRIPWRYIVNTVKQILLFVYWTLKKVSSRHTTVAYYKHCIVNKAINIRNCTKRWIINGKCSIRQRLQNNAPLWRVWYIKFHAILCCIWRSVNISDTITRSNYNLICSVGIYTIPITMQNKLFYGTSNTKPYRIKLRHIENLMPVIRQRAVGSYTVIKRENSPLIGIQTRQSTGRVSPCHFYWTRI